MNLLQASNFTKRLRPQQYVSGKATAIDFNYVPRTKQLFCTSQVVSSARNKLYRTTIVFEGIGNSEKTTPDFPIPFSKQGGAPDFYLQYLSVNTRIRTRCSCEDYYFMWSYWNKNNKSLIGPHKTYVKVPGSNRPPVNPDESPGLCKHLLKLVNKLMTENVIKRDREVWHYINQSPRIL